MDTILTNNYRITCINCGKEHTISESQSFCTSCGHGFPLELNYFNFSPFLQLPDFLMKLEQPMPTTLVPLFSLSEKYSANIYAKCEQELPTGSFKHRGSIVEVLTAKQLGYTKIVCASTGNMGVSLAALCPKHKIKLILFVPKTTPAPKLAAAKKYGAEINYIDGAYSQCEKEAAEFAFQTNAFLAGDYYLRAEGAKLVAGEMMVQLNNDIPDIIIVPGGVGTNGSAIGKGFCELASGGVINKIPQLCIVQSENCCPIIDSLELGIKITATETNTLCSATAVANPYDFVKVKKYVDISNGFGVKVSDNRTVLASKELAELESIDCELSGAMPVAALEKIKAKIINKTVVLIITGAGYKDLHIQEEALSKLLNI